MILRDLATAIIIISFTLATIVGSLIFQGPPEDKQVQEEKSCIDWQHPKENVKCKKELR